MPQSHRRNASQQVLIQLLEADVEMGFALVDVALKEFLRGNESHSLRALQEAEGVIQDIEQRLSRLRSEESDPFRPLVQELRREIDAARAA